MFYVYILRCGNGAYYTGHTDDLEKRLFEHANGTIRGFTAEHLPIKLLYWETFSTREEALATERQIKGWRRAKKEALIRGDWDEVRKLANN